MGDSRIYLWSDGELAQLTSDHSWVNEQIQSGVISPEQARNHPLRNVVTRALGRQAPTSSSTCSRAGWSPGDILLLCSDGLTTMIAGRGHRAHPRRGARATSTGPPTALVDEANERGGEDNITVVLLKFEE